LIYYLGTGTPGVLHTIVSFPAHYTAELIRVDRVSLFIGKHNGSLLLDKTFHKMNGNIPFGCRYWCTELEIGIGFSEFYRLVAHEIEIWNQRADFVELKYN
jgi:hypothetical protein